MNNIFKTTVFAAMMALAACSNETEVADEVQVEEQLPGGTSWDASDLPALPAAEEAEDEADSVVEAVAAEV